MHQSVDGFLLQLPCLHNTSISRLQCDVVLLLLLRRRRQRPRRSNMQSIVLPHASALCGYMVCLELCVVFPTTRTICSQCARVAAKTPGAEFLRRHHLPQDTVGGTARGVPRRNVDCVPTTLSNQLQSNPAIAMCQTADVEIPLVMDWQLEERGIQTRIIVAICADLASSADGTPRNARSFAIVDMAGGCSSRCVVTTVAAAGWTV